MLFIAIPAHNEVETIGVLLWRLRSVLAEFPRDYEVVVYDDASTDGTDELLEGYARTMPLTVLRGSSQIGYAQSLDLLLRHVVRQTRHPRRDAVLLLQADFTDPPVLIPEFTRRFEGGADIVVGERTALADAPKAVHRLFRFSGWFMRSLLRVDGVRDITSTMRLIRIAAIRDLMRECGNDPLCEGDSWTANADLLLKLVPHARRVETVPAQSTYGVRIRETRRVAMRDSVAAFKWAWAARKRRVKAGTAAVESGGGAKVRDDGRVRGSRGEFDEESAGRRGGGEGGRGRTRRGNRSRGRDRDRDRQVSAGDSAAPDISRVEDTVPQLNVDRTPSGEGESRQRDNGRRRQRQDGGPIRPILLPDATEESLSIVDPAAGIAMNLQLGGSVAGSDEREAAGGEAVDESLESVRRRKRRRKKRPRGGAGPNGVPDSGSDAESEFGDDVDVSDGVDEMDEDGLEGADDSDGSDSDDGDVEDGFRARRRGRRGRRGGRRVKRLEDEGTADFVDVGGSGAADFADFADGEVAEPEGRSAGYPDVGGLGLGESLEGRSAGYPDVGGSGATDYADYADGEVAEPEGRSAGYPDVDGLGFGESLEERSPGYSDIDKPKFAQRPEERSPGYSDIDKPKFGQRPEKRSPGYSDVDRPKFGQRPEKRSPGYSDIDRPKFGQRPEKRSPGYSDVDRPRLGQRPGRKPPDYSDMEGPVGSDYGDEKE